MTDTPEDIWAKAMKIASGGKDLAVIRIGIMQALTEERERCAKIAEAVSESCWRRGDAHEGEMLDEIISAIRTPTP